MLLLTQLIKKTALFLSRLVLPLLMASAAIPLTVSALSIEDARKAYQEKDFRNAALIFGKLALEGDQQAQYNLALMRDVGRGIPKRPDLAAYWYRTAALKGHPGARHQLAAMYYSGRAVPKDLIEAHKWWSLAAKQGDVGARFSFAIFTLRHSSDKNRVKTALEQMKIAAEQDLESAQQALQVIGARLEAGESVATDDLPEPTIGTTSFGWTESADQQSGGLALFDTNAWAINPMDYEYTLRLGPFESPEQVRALARQYQLPGPGSLQQDGADYLLYIGRFDNRYQAYVRGSRWFPAGSEPGVTFDIVPLARVKPGS